MVNPNLSTHAVHRAAQRFRLPLADARRRLVQAWHDSFKLPARYASELLGSRKPRRRKGLATVRVTSTMLLVCRGSLIVTCWPLSLAHQATVIWWIASGRWEASC